MIINIDMDGVLVDLTGSINDSVRRGRPLTIPMGVYDLNTIFGLDIEKKLAVASDTWWANCKRTSFATDLVELVMDRFEASSIRILTKYVSPACAAGKIVWMKYNYPRIAEQIVLVSDDKSFACRGDDILVDDYEKNINTWRAVGGIGILVPAPWNSYGNADPMVAIEQQMRGIKDSYHG